jgi:hypothetical protein
MLGSYRIGLAFVLATVVGIGCGGGSESAGGGGHGGTTTTSSTTSTTSTTTSSTTTSSSTGGAPACPTHEGTVFAASKLYFGEGYNGQWKKMGFNVDGKVSTANSTDLCIPSANADPATPYPDGDQGIDNSFGKNLLPLILGLYPTWVTDINNGIGAGTFTALIKVECMPKTGDAPVLTSKLFGGTTLGSKPKWDGTDQWPVEPGLLADPKDPLSTTIVFEKSSITGDLWDSGTGVTFILAVPLATNTGKTTIKLTLYNAHMTMKLSPDRKTATEGMIGGVLNTEELVAEIKKVGNMLNACGLVDTLVTQVRQASDIMSDGTEDPKQTCDGITMGLAFEMTEAQLGNVGTAIPPGATCP